MATLNRGAGVLLSTPRTCGMWIVVVCEIEERRQVPSNRYFAARGSAVSTRLVAT